jgi:hypothetical protein
MQHTCCTACILIGSTSTLAGVPLAPRHELDVEAACLPRATCRPCTKSKRAIRAQSGSYHNISCGSCMGYAFQHTDRTRGLCSLPNEFSLQWHQHQTCFPASNVSSLRGSSSSRFSKNLLPYLSMPIKVPALVSPALCQHSNAFPAISLSCVPICYVPDCRVSRVCEPLRGCGVSVPAFGDHIPVRQD